MALGRIGDKRALERRALQRTAPRERQPALAAAICLLGVQLRLARALPRRDADVHHDEHGLPGAGALGVAAALGVLARSGRADAWDALIAIGVPSVDPVRAPIALAVADRGRAATPTRCSARSSAPPTRRRRCCCCATASTCSSEDFVEERFYAAIRAALLEGARRAPARAAHPAGDHDAGLLICLSRELGAPTWTTSPAASTSTPATKSCGASRSLAKGTFTPGVLSEIGIFGGLFSLASLGVADAVLVASADGVGTKLKVAFLSRRPRHGRRGPRQPLRQRHPRAGRACRCSSSTTSPPASCRRTSRWRIVGGMARACQANGCALLGGETAEMPGFYRRGEYDLAGFIVGGVGARPDDRRRAALRRATSIVGVPSSGLHTNGYSLARSIVFERLGLTVVLACRRRWGRRSARRCWRRTAPICR